MEFNITVENVNTLFEEVANTIGEDGSTLDAVQEIQRRIAVGITALEIIGVGKEELKGFLNVAVDA